MTKPRPVPHQRADARSWNGSTHRHGGTQCRARAAAANVRALSLVGCDRRPRRGRGRRRSNHAPHLRKTTAARRHRVATHRRHRGTDRRSGTACGCMAGGSGRMILAQRPWSFTGGRTGQRHAAGGRCDARARTECAASGRTRPWQQRRHLRGRCRPSPTTSAPVSGGCVPPWRGPSPHRASSATLSEPEHACSSRRVTLRWRRWSPWRRWLTRSALMAA